MANGFIFGGNTGVATPQELQRRRQIANALAQRATTAPRNVGEGLSALGAAIAHRRLSSRIGREEAAGRRSAQEAFAPIGQFLTGGGMDTQAAPATVAGNPQAYRDAIASIESGGNYSAIGPETQGGNRAYGKYQVMDFNIGPWTEEVLGQRLTPEQFLASPEAQDAVFDAKFGQAVEQYGNPSDAASVWFTGRPAAEGAGRSDILGTTGAEYVDRFNQALGGGQAPGVPAQGQFTPEIVQSLLAAAQNPHLTGTQRQIVGSLLDRALTPPERPDPVTLGAEEVLVDPRSGERIAAGIGPQQPPFTLSPGQARFGPGGDVIAQAPREQFRQLTNPQERAQFGIPPEDQTPYQIGPDNRLYAIGPGGTTVNVTTGGGKYGTIPQGYVLKEDQETGEARLEPIPGGPAATEAAKAEAASQQKVRQRSISADIVVQDIDRALEIVETAAIPVTGAFGIGVLAAQVPGTPGADVRNLVMTIRANAGFDQLQRLRENSPTGGALGPVSDMENRLLQATIGSLEQSQTKEQFVRNLKRVRTIYAQIVHGPSIDAGEAESPDETGVVIDGFTIEEVR